EHIMFTVSGPFVFALPVLPYLTGWRNLSLQKAIQKAETYLQQSRTRSITLMSDWELAEVSVTIAGMNDEEFLVCAGKESSLSGADSLRELLERIAIGSQIHIVHSQSDTDHPEMCLAAIVIKAQVDEVSRMIEVIFDEVAGYT